jgi:hypothetical protein
MCKLTNVQRKYEPLFGIVLVIVSAMEKEKKLLTRKKRKIYSNVASFSQHALGLLSSRSSITPHLF